MCVSASSFCTVMLISAARARLLGEVSSSAAARSLLDPGRLGAGGLDGVGCLTSTAGTAKMREVGMDFSTSGAGHH